MRPRRICWNKEPYRSIVSRVFFFTATTEETATTAMELLEPLPVLKHSGYSLKRSRFL